MKQFLSHFSQSLIYDENNPNPDTDLNCLNKQDNIDDIQENQDNQKSKSNTVLINTEEQHDIFPKLDFPQRTLIAFSGGIDSMVLMHQAIIAKQENRINSLRATYIDHGIHEKSKEWGEFCAEFCAKYDVPFTVHRVFLHKNEHEKIANLEANARKARYTALKFEQQYDEWLCTAQHLDDQIETFFIMLLRGSGLNGLSCMAIKDEEKRMCRPLLQKYWTKELILSYAKHYNLQWVDDTSNDDNTYRRNWLRHDVLPNIEAKYPSYRQTMVRSIEHLQQSLKIQETALQKINAPLEHANNEDDIVQFFPYFPQEHYDEHATVQMHAGRLVVGHQQLVKFPVTLKEKSQAAFQKKFIVHFEQLTSKEVLRSWLKIAGLKEYPSLGQLEILWLEIEKVRQQKTFFSSDFIWKNAELTSQNGMIRAYREHLFLFITEHHFKSWIEEAYPKLSENDLYNLRLFKINHRLDEYPLKSLIPFSRIKQRFVPKNRKPIPKTIKKIMQEFKIPLWVKPHLELYSIFAQNTSRNEYNGYNEYEEIEKNKPHQIILNPLLKEQFCTMTGLPLIYHIGGI